MLVRSSATTLNRLREPALVVLIALVVALSIGYELAVQLTARVAQSASPYAPPLMLLGLAAVVGIAVLFRDLRYADLWKPLHILMRGSAIVLLVQIAFDALYPAALFSNLFIGISVEDRVLVGAALVAGAAAVVRPSACLPMLLAYLWFRNHFPTPYQLAINQLDFRTLLDFGLFSITAMLFWRLLEAIGARSASPLSAVALSNRAALQFQKLVWGICVGVHLGNYFHSGLAKLKVGGADPFFWIFHNPTQQALAIGMFRENTPLAGWPALVGAGDVLLTTFAVPLNIFVFFIQIAAPLSVVGRRVMILFTLAFDLMHLAIYASLGAFFFFWIALNIIILISLKTMPAAEFTPPVKLVAFLTAIIGYMSFSTATLGWLDGSKIVLEFFEAQRSDGTSVAVPPAFFGPVSYHLAHGELWIPPGHFELRRGGNVRDRSQWYDALTCGPHVVAGAQETRQSLASIDRLMRDVDGFYRRHLWVKTWNLEYGYPHHAPSNPAFFHAFDATPMSAITGYSYVVKSACPSVEDGRLMSNVRIETRFPLP
ncbi:MAG TPA: hypothetical protein VFT56_14095 [Sphingomonas sp.]|nr:hypothetical protein [Sphingomonas sp.]